MSDAPSKPITIEELARAKAESIMQESAFATVEDRKKWIVAAIIEVAEKAEREEHDRIEGFIGTRNYQQVRAMIERCKFKYRAERELIEKGMKKMI